MINIPHSMISVLGLFYGSLDFVRDNPAEAASETKKPVLAHKLILITTSF